jgi:hypothetical protein
MTTKFIYTSLIFILYSLSADAQVEKYPVKKIPVVSITDLYHPYQDPGDNFDLVMGYALPELDLKAIILDITDAFRRPVANHPTLWKDPRGPREAGLVPVMQLNYIFDRNIPFAMGPLQQMKSQHDKMLDAPKLQQEGVELLLRILREANEPIEVLSFGSARILAVAFNREPELIRQKIRLIHLSGGTASEDYKIGKDKGANAIPGGEWNVALDVHAFLRLLRSDLPIAIYPCATQDGAFSLGPNNSYWLLPDLEFVKNMDPKIRRYLDFAFTKSVRVDFLRAMDVDDSVQNTSTYPKPHHVWETALWTTISKRLLVKHKEGNFEIIPAHNLTKTDKVIPNLLKPCRLRVREDGRFVFEFIQGSSNIYLYDRGDALENQKAFKEALPALYLTFQAVDSN